MVNVNKLKGLIVEKGLSIPELAEKIGIDKTTFYRKINGNGENFSVKEVDKMVTELNLDKDSALAIFFAQIVS